MAKTEFNCNTDFKNVANHDCANELSAIRRTIILPLYDKDGNVNEFANVAAFTKVALQAKLNAANIADRFFPTSMLNNVEAPAAEPKVEADDMEIDHFIRHGVESFKAKMWEVNHKYLARWANFNHKKNLGYFGIDTKGNIEYMTDSATELKVRPIPLESLYFDLENPQSESVFKGTISFKRNLQENKYLRRVINVDDLDFNPLSTADVYGLYDVIISGSPTGSGGSITFLIDGNASQPVLGLKKEDLVLTTGTITSLTEVGAGVYTAAWTLSSGTFTLTGSKSKYSFNTLSFVVT
jgi:hypothetical protein